MDLVERDDVLAHLDGLLAGSTQRGRIVLVAGEAGARPLHPDLEAEASARAWDVRACAPLALGGAQAEDQGDGEDRQDQAAAEEHAAAPAGALTGRRMPCCSGYAASPP